MKKFFLYLFFAICIFLAYAFYKFYSYNKLSDVDRAYIEKNLAKDSAGRGYSDEAQKYIDEDREAMLKEGFKEEDVNEFVSWLEDYNKAYRKMLLSKNKDEFWNLYRDYSIITHCLGNRSAERFNFFKNMSLHFASGVSKVGESDETLYTFEILKRKYFKFISDEEYIYYFAHDFESTPEKCTNWKKSKLW